MSTPRRLIAATALPPDLVAFPKEHAQYRTDQFP